MSEIKQLRELYLGRVAKAKDVLAEAERALRDFDTNVAKLHGRAEAKPAASAERAKDSPKKKRLADFIDDVFGATKEPLALEDLYRRVIDLGANTTKDSVSSTLTQRKEARGWKREGEGVAARWRKEKPATG